MKQFIKTEWNFVSFNFSRGNSKDNGPNNGTTELYKLIKISPCDLIANRDMNSVHCMGESQ